MNSAAETQSILETAIVSATLAGKKAKELQQDAQARLKGERDLVTQADFECEKLIRNQIHQVFPDHILIGEETSDGNFENLPNDKPIWFIDPIDGTVNYSRGMPLWGISIGVWMNNIPITGVIYLPALEELYSTDMQGSVVCNGKPISVSKRDTLEEVIVSNGSFNVGKGENREPCNQRNIKAHELEARNCLRAKNLGSAAVELAWTAAGRFDAYLLLDLHCWDVAAGAMLLQQAGGTATDLQGERFTPFSKSGLFTNGRVHDSMLEMLGELG